MINKKNKSKFDLNGIPPLREAVPLGLQHLFAMVFGNSVTALLITQILGLSQAQSTMLVQGAMLAAAIATLIQLYPPPFVKGYKFGVRLPVIMGTSYLFLGGCLGVVEEYGMAAMVGGQIAGAIFHIFFGLFIVSKIRRIFTPIISGTIITCMGLGLFPTAINNLAGGANSPEYGYIINFIIGLIVALIIIVLQNYGRGIVKDIAILVGIIVGFIISAMAGLVDFSAVKEAAWVSIPKPLAFGIEFKPHIIVMFILLYIVSVADLMGNLTLTTVGGLDRDVTEKELSSGVMGVGLGSICASLLNSIPVAAFSQNAAIVSLNKVVSRFVIATAAFFLILGGISPKIGSIITSMPSCVIGGATLVIFSQIAMAGVNLLTKEELTKKNMLIAGVAIATSLGITGTKEALVYFPTTLATVIGDSSVVLGALIALFLQGLFYVIERTLLKKGKS